MSFYIHKGYGLLVLLIQSSVSLNYYEIIFYHLPGPLKLHLINKIQFLSSSNQFHYNIKLLLY